jgi:hypothetical protein
MRDDYAVNAELRRRARGERKEAAAAKQAARQLGLGVPRLAALTEADAAEAEEAAREQRKVAAVAVARERKRKRAIEARSGSIFASQQPPSKARAAECAAKIDPKLLRLSAPAPPQPMFKLFSDD